MALASWPFRRNGKEKRKEKKKNNNKEILSAHKKYLKLISHILHTQPMCFVVLSFTWHFKIRVIIPAEAAAHKANEISTKQL